MEWIRRLVYHFCGNLARWLFMVTCQLRWYGKENVPPGGAILVVNHQSYLDPALVGGCLMPRPIHFMARASLFTIPAFRALIVACNAFPIERDSGDVKGVKEALRRLKAGGALVVFPEGTRTRDGLVAPMKPGFRLLAERAAVPIVPVLVEGAYGVWPRTRPLPGIGPVNVIFGRPLEVREGEDFAERLREAVRELHDVRHRKVQRSV